MALLPGGGYAQYVKVLRNHTTPFLCSKWDYQTAAAVPEVWCTAYQLLNLVANV